MQNVVKQSVHRLYPGVIEKRRSRAWRMHHQLCNEKYKNDVATNESWFYFDASQGVRDIYYVRSDGLSEEVNKIARNYLHPVAVLVWVDVSTHCKSQLHFAEHGSTITSRYYIDHIIEPFIKYDNPRLFAGDTQKKMTLHQDSAPGHATKVTLSYMKEKKIQVITPTE
ncbi:unnamed protein product [Rotaria socialis]